MAVYKASDDSGTDYGASVDDVLDTLVGFPWQELGDNENQRGIIEKLLPVAKAKFAQRCGRADFCYHSDVTVTVDGSGEDRIALGAYGFCPLIGDNPADVVIDGSSVTNTDLQLEPAGFIRWIPLSSSSPMLYVTYPGIFPLGVRNCEFTITWGYDSSFMSSNAGAEIKYAQARELEGILLRRVRVSTSSDYGVPPGIDTVRLGTDVQYSARGGRYRSDIDMIDIELSEMALRYMNGLAIVGAPQLNLRGSGGMR